MARKNKNDYFQLTESQIGCAVKAANFLKDVLTNYSGEDLLRERDKMHEIEHQADEIHHDILNKLSVEFITPIDQEDILSLVQIIDDVTDALDEVILECYMFHIDTLPKNIELIVSLVNRCVIALSEAVAEMKNFKKPEHLRKLLVEVNTIESEADAAYCEAIYDLFGMDIDAKKVIAYKAVYDSLEDCCDLCEHAADVIDKIIIKNT